MEREERKMKKFMLNGVGVMVAATLMMTGCGGMELSDESDVQETAETEMDMSEENETEETETEETQTEETEVEESDTLEEDDSSAPVVQPSGNVNASAGAVQNQNTNAQPANASVGADWKSAYLSYINSMRPDGSDQFNYALIYVDNDDIPELAIQGACEADGSFIVACNNGQPNEIYTRRLYFNYIEKGGLLCNSEGIMGAYNDTVYKLENGNWTTVFDGEWSEDYSSENPTKSYDIGGQPVDEATYNAKFSAAYDNSRAKELSGTVSKSEMISMLSN
ncbi:hypothetical protein D6856_14440 [Butyrivibrio sp. XB500-5]|nr:hypothetical protein D6856_14440 [Butyrivibrio sp. XB500-5]